VILGYDLYVDYNNGTTVVIMVDPSAREYNLTGLSPYQQVSMTATARTAIGEGPNTTTTTVVTDETHKNSIFHFLSGVFYK